MQLTPYIHINTGVTVYIEDDPQSSEFRAIGAAFEVRTAPFEEDKPALIQALNETKQRILDAANAKAAIISDRISSLGATDGQ